MKFQIWLSNILCASFWGVSAFLFSSVYFMSPREALADSFGQQGYRHLCGAGTEAYGAPPPNGVRMWCRQALGNGEFIREGRYVNFFPDGKVKIVGNYSRDKMNGTWTEYNKYGQKISITNYYNGQVVKKERIDRDGKPVDVTRKSGSPQKLADLRAKRKKSQELNDWKHGRAGVVFSY